MKYKVVYPILGFESEKEYELSHIDGPFYRLEGKKSSFTLVDPFFLRDDYDFEIDDEIANNLKLTPENVMVLNIMVVEKPFENSTINFAAPLIFNKEDKLMGQIVLENYNYSLSAPLREFLKGKDEN